VTPIDVVLVAYRSEIVIGEAVSRAARLGGRVVVVDHGDGESAVRAVVLGATAVHDPANPGFGTGQNRGVAMTTSPFVLLCNPDARLVPEAVQAGAELLRARPCAAAAQGVIVNAESGRPERSQGIALRPVHLLGRATGAKRILAWPAVRRTARCIPALRDHAERVPSAPVDVEALAATCLLVRREAFDQVGGFDPGFFLYGEDIDLSLRLRRQGWSLVALPAMWAVHTGGASAASPVSRETSWWQGTLRFAARWWTSRQWCLAVVASFIRWARLAFAAPRQAAPMFSDFVTVPIRDRRRLRRRTTSGTAA
jgi:GT2 family glycosyltransferase